MKKFALILFMLALTLSSSFAQKWKEINAEALAAEENKEYDKAITLYLKALPLAKKEYGKKSAQYGMALDNLGVLYSDLGKYDLAEPLIKEAIEIRKVVYGETHVKYGLYLYHLATIYKATGKYPEAESLYLQCCEIDKAALGDTSLDYAIDLNNLAALYDLIGQYEKALPLFEKALELEKKILGVNDPEVASVAANLANLFTKMGEYQKAEKLYLELIEISKQNGENSISYGIDLFNMGALYEKISLWDKAESYYLQSATIFKNYYGEFNAYYSYAIAGLANLYTKLGYYEKAEEMFLKAAEITSFIQGKTSREYAVVISNTAELYFDMGQYNKSEQLFKQAQDIHKTLFGEKSEGYVFCSNGLAMVYSKTKNYKEAEGLYLQSLSTIKEIKGEKTFDYSTLQANLATLYSYMEEYDKAEKLALESFLIVKEIAGEKTYEYTLSLYSLAVIYEEMGSFQKSKEYFVQSLDKLQTLMGSEHPEFAKAIASYAILNGRMGDYNLASQLFKQSDSLLFNYVQTVFCFTSEKEKASYLSTLSSYFERSLSFSWQSRISNQNLNGHVYNQQLASRGLILSSQSELKSRIFSENNDTVMNLYEDWEKYNILIAKELSKPVSSRSEKLTSWKEKSNGLEKKLNQLSQLFNKENSQSQTTFEDVKEKLKPGEASIEFISFYYYNGKVWTDSVLYLASVVTKEQAIPSYVFLFEEKQMKGLLKGDSIRTFANLLYTDAQVRHVENNISYGDSLFQLVWKPLMPYLQNINHVYYAPSGILHGITFDAIPMNETQVLSDKYRMSRLTTTAKVTEEKETEFYPTSVALYGGIQYELDTTSIKKNKKKTTTEEEYFNSTRSLPDTLTRGGSWNYLNGTKKEIENIGVLLTQRKITNTTFTGEMGTEESIKALDAFKSPSILHFSTHGFFFPDPRSKTSETTGNEEAFKYSEDPMFRSGLILAGANYVWKGRPAIDGIEDGVLTAYEIANLYLPNTKLVVMSACETGLGDIYGSEGVYGLQRAFKIAGVEYMIMTMWKVLDKETSEFMTLFYQNLLDKKSIPIAFKTTQDNMKNKYRDEPYKWAGFVLIH